MVHRRMRSAPFRSCSGNANVNCGSRLGLSVIAGGSSQIKLHHRRRASPRGGLSFVRVRIMRRDFTDVCEGPVSGCDSGAYNCRRMSSRRWIHTYWSNYSRRPMLFENAWHVHLDHGILACLPAKLARLRRELCPLGPSAE